jgi:hypothetical protein
VVEFHACDNHRKVITELDELVTKFGHSLETIPAPSRSRRGRPPTSTAARQTCGKCGQSVARASKSFHANNHHSLKASEIDWADE